MDNLAYTSPQTVRDLNETAILIGETLTILTVLTSAVLATKRWWHRKRDRQEQTLVKHLETLQQHLEAVLDDRISIVEARLDVQDAHAEALRERVDSLKDLQYESRNWQSDHMNNFHQQRHLA